MGDGRVGGLVATAVLYFLNTILSSHRPSLFLLSHWFWMYTIVKFQFKLATLILHKSSLNNAVSGWHCLYCAVYYTPIVKSFMNFVFKLSSLNWIWDVPSAMLDRTRSKDDVTTKHNPHSRHFIQYFMLFKPQPVLPGTFWYLSAVLSWYHRGPSGFLLAPLPKYS